MAQLTFQSIGRARAVRNIAAHLAVVWLAPLMLAASANVTREHEMKAAAIFNIIAFTEWPDHVFTTPDAPLIIGVLGDGTVAVLLNKLTSRETWRGRRIILQRVSTTAQARSCHVLYIARSEHSRWRQISNQFSLRPILTVSDAENFARHGGVAQLAIDGDKMRMIINLPVARTAGITFSSKLLRLADVIEDRTP